MNNIVLCGFMGCGKSSVGQELARLLNKPFADTDVIIEQNEGITIPEIFERRGEIGFRAAEHSACAYAAKLQNCVISTGGGALTFERNALLFNDDSVFYLDVDFDEICRRIDDTSHRPLFRDKAKAKELFDLRAPLYRKAAHYTVDGKGSVEQVAKSIVALLKEPL